MYNCRNVVIGIMMVGAPFVEKSFSSAILLDVLNLFIMQVLLEVLLLQF